MGDDGLVDFIGQYRAISNKLKKRFLRKTNAAEASDQFDRLAKECDKSDLPEYSALCWLGVANCEASMDHLDEESHAMACAGQRFHYAASNKAFVSPHHLDKMGDWCMNRSASIGKVTVTGSGESSGAASSKSSKVKDCFLPSHHLVNFHPQLPASPHLSLISLRTQSEKFLATGDYESALEAFTEMDLLARTVTPVPFGVYKDIHMQCEIYRVLLVLLLGPSPQQLPQDQIKLLDKYTWIAEPDLYTKSILGEELFFLLQSVVMCCQSGDRGNDLETLGCDLAKMLTQSQLDLLVRVISLHSAV